MRECEPASLLPVPDYCTEGALCLARSHLPWHACKPGKASLSLSVSRSFPFPFSLAWPWVPALSSRPHALPCTLSLLHSCSFFLLSSLLLFSSRCRTDSLSSSPSASPFTPFSPFPFRSSFSTYITLLTNKTDIFVCTLFLQTAVVHSFFSFDFHQSFIFSRPTISTKKACKHRLVPFIFCLPSRLTRRRNRKPRGSRKHQITKPTLRLSTAGLFSVFSRFHTP